MAASIPPASRTWPLWIVMLLFLAAAVSVPAIQCARRPTPPKHLTELAKRIEKTHPEWRIVPTSYQHDENNLLSPDKPLSLEAGFWICSRRWSWNELSNLRPMQEDGPRWQGVVECRRSNAPLMSDDGHYSGRIGGFNLFGDPAMLREIEQAMSESAAVRLEKALWRSLW